MIGYIICGAVVCAAVFSAFSEKLKLRSYEVEGLGELRIVQLSDLHDCRFGKNQSRLIEMVRSAHPDLILMTGDMVNDTPESVDPEKLGDAPILSNKHPMRELLDGLLGLAPVYMVYGNHEANIPAYERLTAELTALGVKLIGGKSELLCLKGRAVRLIGIDDPRFYGAGTQKMTLLERLRDDRERLSPGLESWRRALHELSGERREGELSILLSHRPEEFELYRDFDLSLSGHAHGGQWRLPPFINGLYAPHQGIFPRHAGGAYSVGEGTHIVSRGLSLMRCPRIFNRPEVVLITGKNDK